MTQRADSDGKDKKELYIWFQHNERPHVCCGPFEHVQFCGTLIFASVDGDVDLSSPLAYLHQQINSKDGWKFCGVVYSDVIITHKRMP